MTDVNKVLGRSELPENLKWDLGQLYGTVEKWESDIKGLETRVPDIGGYRGRLSSSRTVIAECLRSQDDLSRSLERLYTWAHLKHDEDLNDAAYQSLHDRAVNLMTRIGTESSYIVPELLSMPKEDLEDLLKAPELEFAKVPLRSIIRQKDHYLSREEERLLAMASEALEASSKAYRMLNDADLRFPTVIDEKGSEVEISHGTEHHWITSTSSLIGACGISAFPMAARLSAKMAQEEDFDNFILMHAMGSNTAGQLGSVVAGGLLLVLVNVIGKL